MSVLNKIKWQAYMRLPGGGIYEKCKSRIKEKDADDLLELFNGNYLDISVIKMYLKGYYSIHKYDIYKFYEKLEKLSCVEKFKIDGVSYYRFNIGDSEIVLKTPNINSLQELSSFRFELLDLVFPYLITNIENFDKLSFNEGPYEYRGVKLKPGDTVFDLGANFGMFSAYAASKGCDVYAFEPLSSAVSRYLDNIKRFYPNIKIVNKAVSGAEGFSHLCVDHKNYGGSFINGKEGIVVPVTTIDSFVEENSLDRVGFIKADIEGCECQMLDGASWTLRELGPQLSLCKYHNLGDLKRMKKKILETNPNYDIDTKWKKVYARVRNK